MKKFTTALVGIGLTGMSLALAAAPHAAMAQEKSIVYVSPNPIGNNPFLVLGREGTEAAAAKRAGHTISDRRRLPERRSPGQSALRRVPRA